MNRDDAATPAFRESATYPNEVISQIQTMSRTGRYEIRGWGGGVVAVHQYL